jgi:hypothetical protein
MKKFIPMPQKKDNRGANLSGVQAGLDVIDTVGECVGEFEIGCGSGFLDVVTGNRD